MTTEQELKLLRSSLRKLAEAANSHGAKINIPLSATTERGWNNLCQDLIDWLDQVTRRNHNY